MTGLIVSREKQNSENTLLLVILAFGIIAVGVGVVIWMLMGGASNVGWWKTLGYLGVFILSLLASGGMVFPIPSLAATCGASGLGLNLMLVGFMGVWLRRLGKYQDIALDIEVKGLLQKSLRIDGTLWGRCYPIPIYHT